MSEHNTISNPWFSIWLQPRATMQAIVDSDPRKDVFMLIWLATFLSFFYSIFDIQPMGSPIMGITIYLLIAMVVAAISAALIFFIVAPITRWTGSWLGGTADTMLVRSAIAWSMVPKIWVGIPFLLVFFFLMLQSTNSATVSVFEQYQYLAILFIPLVIVSIWAFFTYLKCLAQVNNFSAWMAFANAIIAGIVISLIFMLFAFALMAVLFTFNSSIKNQAELFFNSSSMDLNSSGFKLYQTPTQPATSMMRSPCLLQNITYSADAIVYAAGHSGGRSLNSAIDQSGSKAIQYDLDVNSKSRPVILMLTNDEPTIWNLRWTEKTQIEAVMISGQGKQAVAGLRQNVPVIISDTSQQSACGDFTYNEQDPNQLNQFSQQVFGKRVSNMFLGDSSGVINIGAPLSINDQLLTSIRVTPESLLITN